MRYKDFNNDYGNVNIVDQPDGLYVAALFSDETNYLLSDYLDRNQIHNPVSQSSFHTTIVHSRVPVVGFDIAHTLDIVVEACNIKIELWEVSGGMKCLVLALVNPYLNYRFQEAGECGAVYDFDKYKPHITLSYDASDVNLALLPRITFPIHITREYSEPIVR
jgi:hypothetical protein